MNHRYEDLIEIFNNTFLESENTILVKGDDEPIYLPADEQLKLNLKRMRFDLKR